MEIALNYSINPEELLWFLSRGYDETIYKVEGKSIYRAFRIGHEKVLVKITPYAWSVHIDWLVGTTNADMAACVKNFVTEWFDLDKDISAFYHLLNIDPVFDYMVEAFNGLKLVGMPDLFEALCWAIIGQQINLSFAYKLKRRLVEKYGDFIDYEDNRYYLFPSPEGLMAADPDALREMQFSGSKARYLINIASAFATGQIKKEMLIALPADERIKLLTGLKGIGVWTANYALMKSLRDPAAIPYGDAGLINALLGHGVIPDKKELQGMHALFERFKGWEAYLVFYLWRSLAAKPVE